MKTLNSKLLAIGLASVAVAGCNMQTRPNTVERKVASFDYSPSETRSPGAAGMTIILVNPNFADGFAQSGVEPFVSFADSMANDFQEILVSLGYTVLGPYRSLDEIVYSQKESAHLVLFTDIDLKQTSDMAKSQAYGIDIILGSPGSPKFNLDGQMTVAGKLTLKAQEPKTSESLWLKSLEITATAYQAKSTQSWTEAQMRSGEYYGDPGIFNPTFDALTETYRDAMRKSNTYLDPREFQALLPEIRKLKRDKRY